MADENPFGATQNYEPDSGESSVDAAPLEDAALTEHPERIGRYRIEKVLGKGGFGLVYLAHDEQLERPVAVKVPHARLISMPEDAEAYLAEARMVANLDHPGIVPVHDVGSTDNCPCFIVSRFIEGTDLSTRIKEGRLKYNESAELVAMVAEALHYAHKQGLVHRDVKPENILIGTDGKPYVVDFGLALREENIGKGPKYAGTPAYMSPEQARGEGHRVDGRSDVFSLGVVFYELLVGRQPFRGDTQAELLKQVTSHEPRPLRQYDDHIPKELERICHKAMAKRASERYSTAKDLADDLRHFLAEQTVIQSGTLPGGIASDASETVASQVASTLLGSIAASSALMGAGFSSDSQPIKIVPKGLRSFDAHDADFFLELLPGPRDREGLPDSLRFWKTRIEETDPDNTFSVGLIYGPSGCGKSSLVKAGLLPRLSEDVIPVYIEATPHETETRLLYGLRKRCPALEENLNLKETLAALRRGQGIPFGKKVLIVLDQFEQWLHAKKEEENTDLVQALRQCDGGRVQCIVMVRDDFWMAVTQFFRELEVRLLEDQNLSAVDLFPERHAQKVLAAFGRAFGALPDQTSETTKEQKDFLKHSVAGLAEEGKVICVRLALFAEMMKGKSWTPTRLKEIGGTKGVGVTFLEETFSSSAASPEHRYHQKAARAVLKALLPDSGTAIKGHMRSYAELLQASGYGSRPKDFDDLVRILDSEIRLITPTDPEGVESDDDSVSHADAGQKYFQLTHDYLVSSLRDWLTRKQKETRKGRAELRLEEREALWKDKPENRHLPSVLEWANIRTLTEKKRWTEPQRKMMRQAGRVHGIRSSAAVAILIVASIIGVTIRHSILEDRALVQARNVEQQNITRAEGLVESLLKADTAQIPAIIADMTMYRKWTNPKLTEAFDNSNDHSKERLHASLALLSVDPTQVGYLKGRLLAADPEDIDVIRLALSDHKQSILDDLWLIVEQPSKDKEPQLLQAASALALYDSENKRWKLVADKVSRTVVNEKPFRVPNWTKLLQPIRGHLLEKLGNVFRNRDDDFSQTQIDLATAILEQYAADDVGTLAELILDAQPKQFVSLFDEFEAHRSDGIEKLNQELDRTLSFQWQDEPLDTKWAKPDLSIVQRIEAANGLISERFAFCQTMPLEQFVELAELLRKSGYRPIRFRPFAHKGSVQVAAVWTRDGRDWQLLHGLTSETIRKHDEELRNKGFVPLDVAGCVGEAEEVSAEQYGGIWFKRDTDDEDARMYVGALYTEHKTVYGAIETAGFKFRHSLQAFRGLDGQQKYCGVRVKTDDSSTASWNDSPTSYETKEYLDKISWDIEISNATKPLTTKERNTQSLAAAEAKLEAKQDNLNARYARGRAHFYLGNDDKSLEDFNFLIEKLPTFLSGYQFRAVLHARMGKADEAKQDLAKFTELNKTASNKAYLDAVVAAYLGEDSAGTKRLEAFIEENSKDSAALYNAACAYSIASDAFHDKDAAKSKVYGERAVGLLKQAVSNGYRNFSHMETDPDLDPIRDDVGFQQIIAEGQLERRYSAVWQTSVEYESQETHGLSPKEQLERSRELIVNGYRPVAMSAASIGAKHEQVTASVWHRPLVPEDEKEQLAKRQANAAVALLKMGHAERVWPLLKHSPDPRLRSWIIHRLNPMGASPEDIVKRLNEESDVSIRRALILILGEFEDASQMDRNSLSASLLELYRDDPDSGIHGASEWVLRRWGKAEDIAEIDTELATGKAAGERNWYLTKLGHTMIVIPVPVEFLMGSPGTEKDRFSKENLHRKRIGRSFAIASKEVTVKQFQEFLRNTPSVRHSYTKKYAPEENCPQTAVTWYEAAAYCRWLSEQEGIPDNQMCYPPIAEIKEGMKLPSDYLSRTGYRLPSEAEWEYACRSKTLTSRSYGQVKELLGKYAWFNKTSIEHTWPVGSLKPNDAGLFDMQGNVFEWCQERYVDYSGSLGSVSEDREDNASLRNSVSRVLRGGAFNYPPEYVRSANRGNNQPGERDSSVGFRAARTYPLFP